MTDTFSFLDNQHSDTVFAQKEETIKLLSLFGITMETSIDLPHRIKGIFEVFSSLGAGSEDTKILSVKQDSNTLLCQFSLFNGKLLYESKWTYFSELGIFSRSDTIQNTSAQEVILNKAVQKYLFSKPITHSYSQHTRWCYENIGQWSPLAFGGVSLACEGGRTSQGAAPMIGLKTGQQEGIIFHLIPSGNWRMDLKTVSLGVGQPGEYVHLLEIGQQHEHLAMSLSPQERFQLPTVLIQNLVDGSLCKSAVELQKYFLLTDTNRNRIQHPVVYNPWFEHYALLDINRLQEHVAAAVDLGCEVFEIDAGWYGSQPGDWWSQSGDWLEKTDGGFFGKMQEFISYVKKQGLGFGLWMEPERIGANTPIRKAHPEYFSWGNGYYYPKLYVPEVFDYMYDQITGLIEKYGLCWMKMDFNFEFGEDETYSEFYYYYQAWYALLEKIKLHYPKTYLEACAAGGMRNDIATATTYDGHFLSDNVNPWDMQATYQQCCLRLPHYRMIKWLVAGPGAKISLYDSTQIEKIDTLIVTQSPGAGWDSYESISPEFLCQLTVCGPFGLSGNFIDLNTHQKSVIRSYTAFYKQYREFFRESILFMSDEPKNVGDKEGFFHLQYSHMQTGEQLVYIYRYNTARSEYDLRLENLDTNAMYQVSDPITGDIIGESMGEDLMKRYQRHSLKNRHSGKIIRLKKI